MRRTKEKSLFNYIDNVHLFFYRSLIKINILILCVRPDRILTKLLECGQEEYETILVCSDSQMSVERMTYPWPEDPLGVWGPSRYRRVPCGFE